MKLNTLVHESYLRRVYVAADTPDTMRRPVRAGCRRISDPRGRKLSHNFCLRRSVGDGLKRRKTQQRSIDDKRRGRRAGELRASPSLVRLHGGDFCDHAVRVDHAPAAVCLSCSCR
jgi:hypothetical protein